MTTSLFQASAVAVSYGAIKAVRSVSIDVAKGEVVVLLGANGAGKSSFLNAVVGLAPQVAGTCSFKGQDITTTPTERIARGGLSLVFEGRRVFSTLSVRENLILGAVAGENRVDLQERLRAVFQAFPRLEERIDQAAGTLSGGEQQMLAIARALMSDPEMILLDEPSLGLSPKIAKEIFAMIAKLKAAGTTILLVEQNAELALGIADHGYVMAHGEIVSSGSADELKQSSRLKDAYIGGE